MQFCGNKKAIENLKGLLKIPNPPLTFILFGPAHVGKKLAALFFVNSLVAKENFGVVNYERPHPDILSLLDPTEISAQQARRIRSFLTLTPLAGDSKGIIIDNAHLLGKIGANILLKSIEEPPHKTFTIFVTSRPDLLPKTITSRSVKIPFQSVSDEDMNSLIPQKKKNNLKRDLGWISGRPGLLIDYLQNPKNKEVDVLRKYFFYSYEPSIGNSIELAEKISKEEYSIKALEGIYLSLRKKSLSDRDSQKKMKAIVEAQNHLLNTSVNARLCIERALLS